MPVATQPMANASGMGCAPSTACRFSHASVSRPGGGHSVRMCPWCMWTHKVRGFPSVACVPTTRNRDGGSTKAPSLRKASVICFRFWGFNAIIAPVSSIFI